MHFMDEQSGESVTGATGATTHYDRRQLPRIEVRGRVQGRLLALDSGIPLTIHNISAGGFMMQAAHPLIRGDVRDFRFSITDAQPVTLRGRIVHTMRVTNPDGTIYIGGVEFIHDGADHAEHVRRLLEAVR
jgi:hypothetical protein